MIVVQGLIAILLTLTLGLELSDRFERRLAARSEAETQEIVTSLKPLVEASAVGRWAQSALLALKECERQGRSDCTAVLLEATDRSPR